MNHALPFVERGWRIHRVVNTCASRGFAVLATCMVLMLIGALAVTHSHKALLQGQDVVRHRQASQLAFDMAESGLAFALARLNDTSMLASASSSCLPTAAPSVSLPTSAQSFRRWNLPFQSTTLASTSEPLARSEVLGGLRAWCRLSPWPSQDTASSLDCACSRTDALDDALTSMPLPAGPGFMLTFERSSLDPWAVRINSLGCRDLAACPSAALDVPATSIASSAHARVQLSALVKPVPPLLTVPTAAVTSAGPVSLCGAVSAQGLLVHAGGPITSTDPRCATVAATTANAELPARVVAPSDTALAAAAGTWNSLILRLTGRLASAVHDDLQVQQCVASGGDSRARAASILEMTARARRPCQKIWADGDVEWSGSTLGSTQAPVLLMVHGHLRLIGTGLIHGLAVAESVLIDSPSDHLTVDGAVVSSGGAVWLSGRVQPQAHTLARLAASGRYVQVQGSWWDVP